jgi:hypothetical protein
VKAAAICPRLAELAFHGEQDPLHFEARAKRFLVEKTNFERAIHGVYTAPQTTTYGAHE